MRTVSFTIEQLDRTADGRWTVVLNSTSYTLPDVAFSPTMRAYLEKFTATPEVFIGLEVEAKFSGSRLVQISLPSASLAALSHFNPEVAQGRWQLEHLLSEFVVADTVPSYYEVPPVEVDNSARRVFRAKMSWSPADDAFNTYDGDTLHVEGLGRVRLWGVDAPEIPHWDGEKFVGEAEPGGYAARDFLRDLVANKEVVVEIDKSISFPGRLPGQDSDGRWLVMLWARDAAGRWVNVNKALLAKGLVRLDLSVESSSGAFVRHGLATFAVGGGRSWYAGVA